MVELVKKKIHMNRWKGNASTQITLDDDFIVPDTMDDIKRLILDSGEVQIEAVKNMDEKVSVKGKVVFQVLYARAEGGLQTLGGIIPFDETINVQGLDEKDQAEVSWEMEDLNAAMIHSRKLSVKAIVSLDVRVESPYDALAAVDVEQPSENGQAEVEIEVLKRPVNMASVALRRKDTYRIREVMSLSGSKPTIDTVLWKEMRLGDVNTKPLDGKIQINGQLELFLIYTGDGEGTPIQWVEESIPFSGEIEAAEAEQDMIPAIKVHMIHKEAEVKPDADGELRELEIDAVLELDMKLYEEQETELLSDLYSTNRELVLNTSQVCFEQVLSKNAGKCKINDKITVDSEPRLLQICHSEGNVKIDEVRPETDALQIEGALEVRILYLTADDDEPLKAFVSLIPFKYSAEAAGVDENSVYLLNPSVEQLNAMMTGSDAIEIKAVLNLEVLVLAPVCENVLDSVDVEPMDAKKLQELPGIVGYTVQPDDTLWSIAKKFHTTVDNIMTNNNLADENISPGDKLILIKEIAKG